MTKPHNNDPLDENESEIEMINNNDSTVYAERITLKNGLETMRKRKRNAIIGWHNYNIENESEKHYWSRLMLFVPWRDEDQLKANYITYEDKYHDLIDQIKPIEDRFIHC